MAGMAGLAGLGGLAVTLAVGMVEAGAARAVEAVGDERADLVEARTVEAVVGV